jgi:hypothetical protein
MLIQNYKVTKSIFVKKQELRIVVFSSKEKVEYIFTGEDVFSGDYWNSIFIGNELFDLNLYKYPNYKLSLYPVNNNSVDFENIIRL